MSKAILVTGGARSGKSSYAESLYKGVDSVVYIATCQAEDDERKRRIEHHRKSRPQIWTTYEGYYDLQRAVKDNKDYLLDCVTLMVSNIMFDITKDYEQIPSYMEKQVEDRVEQEIRSLVSSVKAVNGNVVIVTNEVGYSIVPDNHIARVYRDIVGRVNQKIAALCDEVYLVCCGIPIKIK
jgi:adenosylcobinamide kinase / adenosylcobinamide-phosphate guanylyltransferase